MTWDRDAVINAIAAVIAYQEHAQTGWYDEGTYHAYHQALKIVREHGHRVLAENRTRAAAGQSAQNIAPAPPSLAEIERRLK